MVCDKVWGPMISTVRAHEDWTESGRAPLIMTRDSIFTDQSVHGPASDLDGLFQCWRGGGALR